MPKTTAENKTETKELMLAEMNWFEKFIIEMSNLVPENKKIKRVVDLFDKYNKKERNELTDKELNLLENAINNIKLTKQEEFILYTFYESKVKSLTDITNTTEYVKHNFMKKFKIYNNKERELSPGLGLYLKKLRKDMGLTLADVKNLSKSNISISYISRIENSSRPSPSLSLLKDLASIYKKPLNEVLKVAGMELDEKVKVMELEDLVMDNSVKINGKRINKEKKKELMAKLYDLAMDMF